MTVELRCETARGRRYARALVADARALLRAAGLARCELSLLLVDDERICELNRDFRHKDRATDVLSFPQLDLTAPAPTVPTADANRERSPNAKREAGEGAGGGAGEVVLGDVVISIETALRQAREANLSPRERLRQLLAHGILHLLGYDHERSPAEARRQFARERKLLAALDGASKRPSRTAHA